MVLVRPDGDMVDVMRDNVYGAFCISRIAGTVNVDSICRISTSMRCITFHSEIVIFKPDINQRQAKAMPLN